MKTTRFRIWRDPFRSPVMRRRMQNPRESYISFSIYRTRSSSPFSVQKSSRRLSWGSERNKTERKRGKFCIFVFRRPWRIPDDECSISSDDDDLKAPKTLTLDGRYRHPPQNPQIPNIYISHLKGSNYSITSWRSLLIFSQAVDSRF